MTLASCPPSFLWYVFSFLIDFPFFCIASHNDVHMGHSCQVGPIAGAPLDPLRLPWLVYVYGPNGFTHEHAVGHNTNVMGYLFLKGTRAMSSSSFLSYFLFILAT